MTKKKIQSDL